MSAPVKLSGWGRHPRLTCRLETPADEAAVARLLAEGGPLIARGAGRAYGDSALNAALTVSTRRLNRMIAFDPELGLLTAEAGVVLGDIIRALLPHGWFPMVTPGTKYPTLGGLIAADVHGKNHHAAGSFGAHTRWIDLMGADGAVSRLHPGDDLFAATVGGMGLTGIILRAQIALQPVESAWIRETVVPASGLDALMASFDAAAETTYSVAWVDALAQGADLGRGLLLLGEHAKRDELDFRRRAAPYQWPARGRVRVPLDAPSFAVSRPTIWAFNQLYWWKGCRTARGGPHLVDWDRYFYPLDALSDWNRLYGPRGFLQFQCVLPESGARDGLAEILEATAAAGAGFLAVLKKFGPDQSLFSFPTAGWTLALDLPARRHALGLVDRLEEIAVARGGRFYLAKDAHLTRARFDASEPRAEAFRRFRTEHNLAERFASAQSERLGL
ncbi:MAG: FAD-binding oxidoreductase [Pseudomonadota bacterium]